MTGLREGQVLCVISTDPGSRREFEMFARQSHHEMLDIREEQGTTRFIMRKTAQQMTA
jgi:tRNA 2-thiouridine synthesizing protein A